MKQLIGLVFFLSLFGSIQAQNPQTDADEVVVLKNADNTLPLDLSVSGTSLVTIAPEASRVNPFYRALRDHLSMNWIHLHPDSLDNSLPRLIPAQRLIVALYQEQLGYYDTFLSRLAQDKPLIVVCFASAGSLNQLPQTLKHCAGTLVAPSPTANMQDYVVRVLLGKATANGRLKQDISSDLKKGTGLVIDPNRPKQYRPEDFGMQPEVLSQIDEIAGEGIREGAFPGCHVLILKNGLPVYNRCFGLLGGNGSAPVMEQTLYDLGSLTTSAATLLAVMKLYDEGKFGLTDPIGNYVSWLKDTSKGKLTISSLLLHESGFAADIPYFEPAFEPRSVVGGFYRKNWDANHRFQIDQKLYANTTFTYNSYWVSSMPSASRNRPFSDSLYVRNDYPQVLGKMLVETPLKGKDYRYSTANYLLLQALVEALTEQPFETYLMEEFYKPMGLTNLTYLPLRQYPKSRVALSVAVDFLRRGPLQGYPYDPSAAFMGGISGSAGLFASVSDVGRIFQMLLNKGVLGDRRYLSRMTCNLFLTMRTKSSKRAIGLDLADSENPDYGACSSEMPGDTFGRIAENGCSVWADPQNDLIFVLLCNATYPEVKFASKIRELKIVQRMQQAMYQALKK